MKYILVCASSFLILLSSYIFAHAEGPNVVFILADDLGWGDVEFHNGSVPTPHLNELCNSGIELTRHYVAPLCSPTRTSLLTGRFWSRFGVTSPTNDRVLAWDTETLPKAFADCGYRTCLTGKWHLGSLPEWGPNHFGFTHSYGSLAGGVGPYSHRYKRGPYSQTWHRNESLIEENGHVTDLITNEAVRWIEDQADAPFLLYVPFTAVHLPLQEPAEWVNRAKQLVDGELPVQYAAATMHLDDAVGKIVTALDSHHLRDDTLIIFTSDNGASVAENNDTRYPGAPYPQGRLPGNNAPLRGHKGQLYEGGIRVPTIVNWPAKLSPGHVDTPAIIADWMPTLCELIDYNPPVDLHWDGTSLWQLLLEGKDLTRQTPLYFLGPDGDSRVLRVDDWKLVIQTGKDHTQIQLFNLARDESETTNLADKYLGKVGEMLHVIEEVGDADGDAKVKEKITKAN